MGGGDGVVQNDCKRCWFPYSLNGARFSTGVVPLDCLDCGSTDPFLGVCMPDGVEDPLRLRLCTNEEKRETKY